MQVPAVHGQQEDYIADLRLLRRVQRKGLQSMIKAAIIIFISYMIGVAVGMIEDHG